MGRRVVVEADGGSRGNPGPAGYGAVVRDAETGEVLAEVAAGIGRASNNVAEYQGLIAGLRAALEVPDVGDVDVRMDSKLVVEQMAGRWQVKHPDMRTLRREAAEVVARLPQVTFTHIRRALNSHADRLANEAMDAAARGEPWERREVTVPAAAPRSAAWQVTSGTPTVLLLLRHGQTAMTATKQLCGSADPPLSERGVAEAEALAARVAALRPVAVWTSPLARAAGTAAPLARLLDVEPRLDERLRETDFGTWEGMTLPEVHERYPDELAAWRDDTSVAAPGGESLDAVARRVRQARDAIVAAHPGETVAVVTHVTPVKLLLRLALDAPAVLHRLHLDAASITHVEWYPEGGAIVRRVNDTAHLDALTPPADM